MLALTDPGNQEKTQPPRAIEQLPVEVIAQIKSSIAINSLSDVILALIKNSLDANADRIDIVLDVRRGNCTVEDNGCGIRPTEFTPEGGLGKMYYTSRYHEECESYGQNGTFLASLAALSLLTVTSRHVEHHSTNSLTLHKSKCISRSTPLSPQNAIFHAQQGTVISVRDLFGSMPVRVKQRAALEERTELEKYCTSLKRAVLSLAIACGKALDLKLQQTDFGDIVRLRKHPSLKQANFRTERRRKSGSELIQCSLTALIDAKFITVENRQTWIPVSASTGQMAIKGAISTEPAPTRSVQFVSLGQSPLSTTTGHKEVFDAINKVFSDSSFGALDDTSDVDETEVERRSKDRRYKSGGYTQRQLSSARKGLDRWPMFLLHIQLPQHDRSTSRCSMYQSNAQVHTIVELLSAMVTQWLESQDMRPPKRRRLQHTSSRASSTFTQSADRSFMPGLLTAESNPSGWKRAHRTPQTQRDYTGIQSFNELSRIKSGSASFYDSVWGARKSDFEAHQGSVHESVQLRLRMDLAQNQDVALQPDEGTYSQQGSAAVEGRPKQIDHASDATMTWRDPVTREMHLISSRTGTILPCQKSNNVDASEKPGTSSITQLGRYPQRLSAISSRTERDEMEQIRPPSSGWLKGFLKDWDNPIFRPQEQAIKQTILDVPDHECCGGNSGLSRRLKSATSSTEYVQRLKGASSRLSKDGLRHARVISQVDRKFILVSIADQANGTPSQSGFWGDMLVLIDQHAADERVKVESLLRELCTAHSPEQPSFRSEMKLTCRFKYVLLPKPLIFSVSSEDSNLLRRHAAYFARWSILYDTSGQSVRVLTLPPVIAERLKTTPQLLIDLLRSGMYAVEHGRRARVAGIEASDAGGFVEQPTWLSHLTDCPSGLLELVNSRACRSAMMFNDILDEGQCQQLVDNLAQCIFPFMCAHGRPSMVPIVGLGSSTVLGSDDVEKPESVSYAAAFETWQASRNFGQEE